MSRNIREYESGQPVTILVRLARLGYFLSLLLLIVGIFVEVFFAGEIMMVNASAVGVFGLPSVAVSPTNE